MAKRWKKIIIYIDEQDEQALKEFDCRVTTKDTFKAFSDFISNFVVAIDETKDTIITDVNPKLLQRMSMTEDEEYRNAGIDKADAQKEEKEKIIDMYAEKGT